MTLYDDQRSWSDRYINQFKMVAGLVVMGAASDFDDMKRNTDLIVLTARNVRIACRVRRFEFLERYGGQFTVRCESNGADTEYDKVMRGWGDYFIYAFAQQDESVARLKAFRIIDLAKFRQYCAGQHRSICNKDGTKFYAFNVCDYKSDLIVFSKGHEANTRRQLVRRENGVYRAGVAN